MTVGAINSVYQYNSVYAFQFFSQTISNDRMNYLMREYGISQTGDNYKDMKALYEAMFRHFSKEGLISAQNSIQPNNQAASANIPWGNLMSSVGLSASGDYSKDYSAFLNVVSEIQSGAKSTASKASVKELLTQAQAVFVQQPQQQNVSKAEISGADIISAINRSFISS